MNKKKVMKKSLLLLAIMSIMMFALSITAFAADAPTGLKQTDDSQNSVTVSWNPVLGANIYYNVYYSTKPDSGFVRVGSGNYDTSNTSYKIGGLTAGQSYYVAIKAVERVEIASFSYEYNEVSGLSEALEVVTCPSKEGMTIEQSGATTKSITVTSSEVYGANQYILKVEDTEVVSKTSTITSQKNLTPATRYYVYVYPCRVSASGYVARGILVYQATSCKTVATKPGKEEVYCSNYWSYLNQYDLKVEISGGSQYDGIQWQVYTTKGKKKINKTGTSRTLSINNAEATFYKYRVRSYVNTTSGKKYSKWSDYKYIGNPKRSKVSLTKTKKKINVNWGKVSGATSYTVYVSTKENSGYQKVKTVKANKRSVVISKYKKKSLKTGKKYYVKIVSKIKIGKKTYTTETYTTYNITL